jgi:hypothetical protein
MIHTTISMYLPRDIWLAELLAGKHLDKQDLIKICLKKLAKQIRKEGFQDGARKYQPITYAYDTQHFTMTDDEYCIYADLQKVAKLCFSKLIALALDLYAEKVLEEKIVDSYQHTKYLECFLVYKNFPCYVFTWDEYIESEEVPILKLE